MTIKTMTERFEEAFLAGRSRDNPLFASLLHRGADGEYFNQHTQIAFAWFVKGAESVVVELPKGGSMWDDEHAEITRHEAVAAIEAAGGKVAP